MDRSIYTALNSMNILRDNQAVTAQNLANISVTGFQKDVQINFSSVYLDRDKGIDPRVLALQEPGGFDSTPGSMQQTGAPLDLAVDGTLLLNLLVVNLQCQGEVILPFQQMEH